MDDASVIKHILYGLLFPVLAGALIALRFAFDFYLISRRRPRPAKPLTELQVLVLILVIISLCLAAFLYFRATFPH